MTTNETKQDNTPTQKSYFQELTAGEARPMPESESWEAKMQRIAAATEPEEIDEDTYFWFLEVLPPRVMTGSYFCFAEGMEPFRLFWERSGRCFVRQLDWTQTKTFCRLANRRVNW